MKTIFKLFLAALILFAVNISHAQNSAVLAGTGAAGSQDLNSVLSLGNDANNNQILNASGLSVGTATVGTSSVVDIASTTAGLLIPRMTTVQRDAIGTPATGLMVYNTTDNAFNFYNGTVWTAIGGGGATTLTGLTDVNTAPTAAGTFLVADGVDYEGVTMSGDATMAASGALTVTPNAINQDELAAALTFADADYIDLSAILHDDAALQGFRLPQIGATPTNLGSGEGFLGWDETNNTLEVFDGTAWTAVGGGSTTFTDDVFRVQDDGDNTRQLALQLSGLTTATTRTLTAQDADGTIALVETHGIDDVLSINQGVTAARGMDMNANIFSIYSSTVGGDPTDYMRWNNGQFTVRSAAANIQIDADAGSPYLQFLQNTTSRWAFQYIASSAQMGFINAANSHRQIALTNTGLSGVGDFDASIVPVTTLHAYDEATTAGISAVLRVDRGKTSVGAAGDGSRIELAAHDDINTSRVLGEIDAVYIDPDNTAWDSYMAFNTYNNTLSVEVMRLLNTAQVRLPGYTSVGVFGTTPIGVISVDATGNLDVVANSNGTNRVITANDVYTAADNGGVIVADNTADAAVLTYTLNGTPANGDQVTVFVAVPGTNGVTILRNGNNINGAAADVGPTLAANTPFILEFTTGYGWAIIN